MTGCVNWHKSVGGPGYGQTFRAGKFIYAHRAAWEDVHGPIPAGMQVHHRCGNRRCVNVEHLDLLSRQAHAGGDGHGKLTQALADEVRHLVRTGWRRMDIASAYGISRSMVGLIATGKRWAA